MPVSRLDELFDAALEIAPEHRAAWLGDVCGADVELRRALDRLLAADVRADGMLEAGPELIAEVLAEQVDVPDAFGVWRVQDALGAGGMGEVWLAERDDAGFVQRAAIKQVAYPTPGLLQRFERERRILARLEHPGIARLIDGGVDNAGCPWLAMEYVEGRRIDDWARSRELDVRGTIKLLLRVCEAVQFAHRNLVVHSDLKPSNILVDGDGKPRLLDFGIARVLSEVGEDGSHTATRLMTPDYAAPEWLAGGVATTAVDVYALGVLAYQLLCGHKPYRLARDGNVARQLDNTNIPPPSAIVAADLPDPRSRRRTLRGDLDRVVLTAMANQPARRYATVEAFATDLRNWLDGRAVLARGDGTWYRMRKFVGRNRVAVAIAATATIALLAATAFSLYQARVARQQVARAEAITRFLTDMFRVADPKGVPGGLHLTARQMLDAGAQRYDRELRDQPALAARFSTILAGIYSELGEYDKAISLAGDALDRADIEPGERARAYAVLARAQYETGDYPAARASVKRAAMIHAAEDGRRSASVAADIALEGEIARRQGDFELAEQLTRKALGMSRVTLAAPDAQIAGELSQLASLYGDMRRVEDARAPTEEALAMLRELYGDTHLDIAENMVNLATIDMQTGKVEDALPLYDEAEAMYRKLLPVAHPLLATALVNHARALERAGRFQEAPEKYLEALAMQRRLLGESHPDVATTLNNMAVLDVELGEYQKAVAGFREVLEIWKKQGKPNHPLAQITRIHLATALRELGNAAESEELLRSAQALADTTFGKGHPITLMAGIQLGATLREEGKAGEALVVARGVDQVVQGSKQLPALFKLQADVQYALDELATGEVAAAQARMQEVRQIIAQSPPINPLSRSGILQASARVAIAADDLEHGCEFAREAVTLARKSLGEDNVRTAHARDILSHSGCPH